MELTGKRVVVTGAAGVLGQAVAARSVALGASVVMLDIVEDFSSTPGDTRCVDLTDAGAVETCIAGIGDFDAVCNIAGGFDMGPGVHEIDDAHWDAMFDINVTTLRNMLRATLPRLVVRGRGSVVNVGALGALSGQAAMGAYTAAKSVVMRLTEAAAQEVRRKRRQRQCRAAQPDRHAAQPGRHAECESRQLGVSGEPGERDLLPGFRCGRGGARRADSRQRQGLATLSACQERC